MERTCRRCGKRTTSTGGWTKHQKSCREKEQARIETDQILLRIVQANKGMIHCLSVI